VRIAQSAHRQNFFPVIVAQHGGAEDRVLKEGGKDVEGLVLGSSTVLYTSPLAADYRNAVARFVPGGVQGALGLQQWGAGKLLERLAANFGPTVTSRDVLNGLYNLHGESIGGLVAPTTFTKGTAPTDGDMRCSFPATIQNGAFVPLNNGQYVCPPA
jgi:branched-chain amino acid transport system substrate-binding protein